MCYDVCPLRHVESCSNLPKSALRLPVTPVESVSRLRLRVLWMSFCSEAPVAKMVLCLFGYFGSLRDCCGQVTYRRCG